MEFLLVVGGFLVAVWLWKKYTEKRVSTERSVPEPDWNAVRDHLSSDERQVDACKGWTVGGDIDHPCAVFLTDRAIYVDVRPDTLAPRETVSIPFSTIRKCGVQRSDQGTPRLVVVADPEGDSSRNGVRGIAVDLRPEDYGWKFGQRVETSVQT